jgi:alkanesulfonate monooxygenase SsuD/methylene tetrahydromethanopterin reductase-like flavin-dependent oxidoreductase (luciferase family)
LASVSDAVNVPKGIQPHIPVIIGGNGQNVTFRYAARFADELNLVYIGPERIAELLPVIRSRCEEIGRDPATLNVSLYARDENVRPVGQERVDFIAALADLGLSRLVAFIGRWSLEPDAQASFAEDVRAAGLELEAPEAAAVGWPGAVIASSASRQGPPTARPANRRRPG